jgi:DNA-binding PadR family transcriptional regulator
MEAAIQRKCSMGALYTTMDRLEAKGLLKTWVGESTPQRGGRGKRMVRVTSQGVRAAKEFYDSIVRISQGASWVETSWVENSMEGIS